MNKFYKNKEDIINWLDGYKIKDYILIPADKYGFVVDVSGNVSVKDRDLEFIPVKFNKVDGFFNCSNNKLTSLEFSPSFLGKSFLCSINNLSSLNFCPNIINGSFYCYQNKLSSLEFCPESVSDRFDCSDNRLTSLKFCPIYIGRDFYCHSNQLTSLEFCPKTVGGSFYCSDNPKLQESQEINDFKEIYAIHKKLLVEKFAGELDTSLNDIETNKKINKIKL